MHDRQNRSSRFQTSLRRPPEIGAYQLHWANFVHDYELCPLCRFDDCLRADLCDVVEAYPVPAHLWADRPLDGGELSLPPAQEVDDHESRARLVLPSDLLCRAAPHDESPGPQIENHSG